MVRASLKKCGWYLSMAAVGAGIAFACSSPPDGESLDPTLNAAAGCLDEACSKCASGYNAKLLDDGTKFCSSKKTVTIPVLRNISMVEAKTGLAAQTLTPDRYYQIDTDVYALASGSVTVWAEAILTDASKPAQYLCKVTSLDLSQRSGAFFDDSKTNTPLRRQSSLPFTIDDKCVTAANEVKAKFGNIARIALQYSFDVEGVYDVVRPTRYYTSVTSRELSTQVLPWNPRDKFTSAKLTRPDAGYDGSVNDAGLALIGTSSPDEAAYLSQRKMTASEEIFRQAPTTRVVTNSKGKAETVRDTGTYAYEATLATPPPQNVGDWSKGIPEKLSIEGSGFSLNSSVITISPRFIYGSTDYRAAETRERRNEFGGTFSYLVAGDVPGNRAGSALSAGYYKNAVALRVFMRPEGSKDPADWTSVTESDGARVSGRFDTPLLGLVRPVPAEISTPFSIRANNVIRIKLYREWFDKNRFQVAACPVIDDAASLTARQSLGLAGDAEDPRCKKATITLERTPLGGSGKPNVDKSPNDGAAATTPAGNGNVGTAQSGTNATSCTKNSDGTQSCKLDQGINFNTTGAYQANVLNTNLATSTVDDGKKPDVQSPAFEVLGFNLFAGNRGDKVEEGSGTVKFPVGAWIQSLLNKADKPRPPGGGINVKTFRPGERAGLAYVLERSFPPACGAFGCVQVIVSFFAGGILDADVTITPQTVGNNPTKIPCAASSDPEKCFKAYPGEGGKINNLSFADAAKYCYKIGGRIGRIIDADEHSGAATALKTAVREWNEVKTNPTVKNKAAWLGFEKTMILSKDPATCQEVINNGKVPNGICVNNAPWPDTEVKTSLSRTGSIAPTTCANFCRNSSFPFYALYKKSVPGRGQDILQTDCGCLDTYGAGGIAKATDCDQTCEDTGNGSKPYAPLACGSVTPLGRFAVPTISVYSTNQQNAATALQSCIAGARPAWAYSSDDAVLESMANDGSWVVTNGAYSQLVRKRGSDKFVTIDADGPNVVWPTEPEDARHYPLCEFQKATSAQGVAVGLTFTPTLAAGASLAVIYGNRYVAGIGVKLTVNFVAISFPILTEFNTVSAVRQGKKIVTGGALFQGDLKGALLSGSLGVVLYTTFHDFEYPIFEFGGFERTLPIFKLDKMWRY
jgi:hypothetical protein